MISTTAEYALRLVMYLAENDGRSWPAKEIASIIQVPTEYLYKIIQHLCREGVLKSRRGIGGGVTLATTPDKISLYDVVNSVSPVKRIHSCPLKLPEHEDALCSLHAKLDASAAHVEGCFRETSLLDLMNESQGKIFGEKDRD